MHLITADEAAVREACREVLSKHGVSSRVRAISESVSGFDDDLWKSTAELGWPALGVSEAHDGLGMSTCQLALVVEEFGRVVQPSLLPQQFAVSRTIERHGSAELCAAMLPQLAVGDVRATWATGAGGTVSGLVAQADPTGFRLSGEINWVPDAQAADLVLVAADLDGATVLVLVETTSPGVSITMRPTIDLTRRYATVTASDVLVDAAKVIVADAAAADLFELGVLLQRAESVGIASSLLDTTVAYAKLRHQFGVPIGSFQALKHRMADMLIEQEAARASAWDAAELWDASTDRRGIREAISVAKTVAAPAANSIASDALQILGGIGFAWEHDLHLFLRRAKVNEMTLGTVPWHRDRLIGLLG